MKIVLSIFMFIFSGYNIFAQSNCIEDSIKYNVAYEYINKCYLSQNKIIAVSDTIVDLDRFWFIEDLDKYPKEKIMISEYRAKKDYKWYSSYHLDCIDFLFFRNNSIAQNVLFFSKIEDNMLVAEIFSLANAKKYTTHFNKFSYDWISLQNKSQIFLFLFDEDRKIKDVFNHYIIYD